VPVLPLVGDEPASAPEDGGTPVGSGRTLVGVLVAVVLVLVVLSTLSGGDGAEDGEGEQDAAATTTSTTERRTSTTRRPTTTTVPGVAPALLEEGAALDPGLDLVAIADTREGGIVAVDLGTGAQVEIPDAPGSPNAMAWTGEALLAQTGEGLVRLAGTIDAPWVPVDTGGAAVGWMDPSGLVSLHDSSTMWPTSAAVDGDGVLRTWRPSTEVSSQLMGSGRTEVLGDMLLVETADGIFTVDPDGEVRRLSYGRLIGTGGDRAMIRRCDDRLRCEMVLLDRAGVATPLPRLAPDVQAWAGGVAPNGTDAWVAGSSLNGGETNRWVAAGDEWVPIANFRGYFDPYGGGQTTGWASDGRMAWWDQHREVIEVVDPRDPQAEPLAIAVNANAIRDQDMGRLVLLVPRTALPPAFLPAG
jgi:hypothetical protein